MFEEYQFGNWREVETAGTLRSHEGTYGEGSENIVTDRQYAVRRLTPLECERLQSLPDGWTYLPGNKLCSDSARYRALGNGMAQNCPTWILKRLVEEVEKEKNDE